MNRDPDRLVIDVGDWELGDFLDDPARGFEERPGPDDLIEEPMRLHELVAPETQGQP